MIRSDGYKQLHRYDLEHRLVAERVLGRPLPAGAVIHHVNGDKQDNRGENLVICPSHAYHALLHRRQRALETCGHADWLICPYCHKYDDPANLYVHRRQSRHRECFNASWRSGYHARKKQK
jgi:hypothetical protein